MTDNLADIIQLIHLGAKDGTLTVERSTGMVIEEGYIVFVKGTVVEARVGQYSGMAAFNYLNTWRTCRFSFVSGMAIAALPPAEPALPGPANGANGASRAIPPPSERTMTPMIGGASNTYANGSASRHIFPVRLPQGEETLQYLDSTQIPRLHRRLLLLVNGQRSTTELARLMGRSPAEVRVLLDDLEHAGLIRQ
jgi:hypothetical protein